MEGARLLSPKTVEFMRMNHLPGGKTIKEMGDKTFSEARMEGNGFGLGGSTVVDVAETLTPWLAWHVQLGRACQYILLDRPGRRIDRNSSHADDPNRVLSDPAAIPAIGLCRDRLVAPQRRKF